MKTNNRNSNLTILTTFGLVKSNDATTNPIKIETTAKAIYDIILFYIIIIE